MTTRRWRIEKIHERHPAHLNNPDDYPAGWWYFTDDGEDHWEEGGARSWHAAIRRVQVRMLINDMEKEPAPTRHPNGENDE